MATTQNRKRFLSQIGVMLVWLSASLGWAADNSAVTATPPSTSTPSTSANAVDTPVQAPQSREGLAKREVLQSKDILQNKEAIQKRVPSQF